MRRESAHPVDRYTEKSSIKRLLYACMREQLLSYSLRGDLLIIPLKRNQKMLLARNVQQFNLGKLRIDGDIMLVNQHQFTIMKDVRQLLELIRAEIIHLIDSEQWEQFVKEIINCTANEALVSAFVNGKENKLVQDAHHSSHKNLIDYVTAHHSVEEQLIFFEAFAVKGHPYHPCHKTKLGFSTKAYLKYSPEFNQDIDLPVAAIKRSLVHIESEAAIFDYHQWFAQQFPEQWAAWCAKLASKHMPLADYAPLFIHPWQYENVLTKLFQPIIKNKQLQLFNDIVITTKASLSFRTLIVKDNHHQPHIKLPVAVHSTSALRTISPASVQNGPKLGKILKAIFAEEKNFGDRIKLAYESCGLHINGHQTDIAKHLAIIYRENPSAIVRKNETPIVIAALFEESPITGLPLFIEILQAAVGDKLSGAKEYFDGYCRVVIQAYLDLLLVYGIALEGHQQNTIAVFENYYPNYMIARDLGGIRVHPPTLEARGYDFQVHPGSSTSFDDRQEVTNNFLHTVIQYHLGEIVLLLSEFYHTQESVFWKILKNNLEERFQVLKSRIDTERWQQEYDAVMKDDWKMKGLMRMRLKNVYTKYIYINLKNPLRDI